MGLWQLWQKRRVAIHFATHLKSLNDSLRFHWEFVGLDPNEISTKFQRFVLWQNVVAKRFVKMLVFFDFGGCTKQNPWNFVKISLGKRPNPRNPNEILAKQNRQNPVIQGLIANGQISW